MIRTIIHRFAILFLTAVMLLGCTLLEPALEVEIALSADQGDLVPVGSGDEEVWVFPMYFGPAVTPPEEVSTGDVLGATVVRLTATANRVFHITGLRIEQVLYRPEGASSEIGFVHPTTYEPLEPFFLELPGGATIDVVDSTVFDVDVATVAGPWQYVDMDADGTPFPDDQDEVASVSASLFVEGYVEDGTVITAHGFPAPVRLYIDLSHKT